MTFQSIRKARRTRGVKGATYCSSTYNPTPAWGHVCNDDAHLQYDSVKDNKDYGGYETSGDPFDDCNTWGLALDAPTGH